MDERVRQLERAFKASNDPADEGRWLAALVQSGRLSRGALEVAALLGAEGAQAAAPELALAPGPDPWVDLARWARKLDRRLATNAPASHRALLAEAERLLTIVLGAEDGLLVVTIDPRNRSTARPLDRPLSLTPEGPVGASAGAWATLRPTGEACQLTVTPSRLVLVNGVEATGDLPVLPGDLIQVGSTRLGVGTVDGEALRAHGRRARAALDELTAAVLGAPAPSGIALEAVSDRGGPAGDAAARLTRLVSALSAAIRSGAPRGLNRAWPSDLAMARAALGDVGAVEHPAAIRAAVRDALVPWLLGRGDPLRGRAASALDRLEVASPCPLRWEDLSGTGRVRDCGQCGQQVYDISAMTRADAAALLRAREGQRLCVRLYRRADGKVMTRDCPDEGDRQPRGGVTLGRVAPMR